MIRRRACSGRCDLRAAAFLLLACLHPTLLSAADPVPQFHKGITFTHGYRGGDDMRSQRAEESLRYLRRHLAIEWIALNPFGYQRSVKETDIRFRGDPPDEHLANGIREARALGFKVMLKPHIWLREQSGDDWRGTIGFSTEQEWNDWFASYERFILHYARIAAETETEIFCIGVELSRTVSERPDDWRRLIAQIRAVYPGPLTYAANWWGDYDVVEFWDELDYIGVNAFFPISDEASPTDLASLTNGARAVADQIEKVHERTGKPVLLTEIGYRSVRGSTVRPWEWPRRDDRAIDLHLQERAYQAVLKAFWPRDWFYGLYWWKWHSDMSRGGARNNGFSPRGKPAEDVISDWYSRPAPRP
ncbi:MAG: hypothetical protein HN712_01675 [Gemmatimonadetes bacterium]|nr:hypothetical protein [Gemmatimonadota bacterium]